MNVIRSVRHRGTQLPVRDPPVNGVVVEEEDASELASGVEVGPVDGRTAGAGAEDEGMEGGVERGKDGEVRRVLRVAVAGVDRRRRRPPPFLAEHGEEIWRVEFELISFCTTKGR